MRTLTVRRGQRRRHAGVCRPRSARAPSRGWASGWAARWCSRQAELGDSGARRARCWPSSTRRTCGLARGRAGGTVAPRRSTTIWPQADFKRFKELRDQGFISARRAGAPRDHAEGGRRRSWSRRARRPACRATRPATPRWWPTRAGVVTAVDAEPGHGAGRRHAGAAAGARRAARRGVRGARGRSVAALRPLLGQPGALSVRLWGDDGDRCRPRVREVAAAADPVTRTFLVKADVGRAGAAAGPDRHGAGRTAAAGGRDQAAAVGRDGAAGPDAVWLLDRGQHDGASRSRSQVAGADGNEVVIAGRPEAGPGGGDGRRARADAGPEGQAATCRGAAARRPRRPPRPSAADAPSVTRMQTADRRSAGDAGARASTSRAGRWSIRR